MLILKTKRYDLLSSDDIDVLISEFKQFLHPPELMKSVLDYLYTIPKHRDAIATLNLPFYERKLLIDGTELQMQILVYSTTSKNTLTSLCGIQYPGIVEIAKQKLKDM